MPCIRVAYGQPDRDTYSKPDTCANRVIYSKPDTCANRYANRYANGRANCCANCRTNTNPHCTHKLRDANRSEQPIDR